MLGLIKFTVIIAVVVVLVLGAGNYLLNKNISRQVDELFSGIGAIPVATFSHDEVKGLPEPVQRYLGYSLKEGQVEIKSVRLKQKGLFRLKGEPGLKADEGWVSVKAEQYFNADDPGFVWHARMSIAPLIWMDGWDAYDGGKGSLRFKLLSLLTVADAKPGEQLDRGELLRFLSEMPWYPTAFAGGNIQWLEMDDSSARAILKDANMEVEGVFYFNEKGEITHFVTSRYRMVGDEYSYEKWTGYYRDYQEMDGVKVPTEVEVVWNLDEGDLSYAKLQVTEIEYNLPMEY